MTNPPFLSLVIPTWNEEERIQSSLETVVSYLCKQEYSSEVIVVDDGSTDRTREIVKSFIATLEGEVPLHLIENDHRGKGYAVRTGVLSATGKYILFTDADLATPVYEIGKMVGALEAGCEVAIGTREGIGAERLHEPLLRHLLGRVFNLLVQLLAGLRYRDTQAGFKGFRRQVAHDLFARVQLYGADAKPIKGSAVTAFDVEVLYLATQAGYRIEEIPVKWEYGAQSKIRSLAESVRMLGDVIKVRWMATKGVYDN